MSQLTNLKEHLVCIWTTLRASTIPQDGPERYIYDIWQPLTILGLTTAFMSTFFAWKDPSASTNDLFYCNADGNIQMEETGGYKPFWDINLFFTINVPVGENLSFTLAKLIDAVWDLGIGRGGQLLVALVTYRVLRRSLTLVMESCKITIPTVTSVYCQQIGITSSWHLLAEAISTKSSRQFESRRLSLTGRRRLLMQLYACSYVLVFPTLTSVMTGYRTGFTGLFDYKEGTISEVKPLAQLEIGSPQMVVRDGSRAGLSNWTSYMPRQMPLPIANFYTPVNITAYLLSSKSLEEPAGVLVDCKCLLHRASSRTNHSDAYLKDYLTCLGVMAAARTERHYMREENLDSPAKVLNLACAFHDCSCSVRIDTHLYPSLANMASNITILGTHHALSAPPLDILFSHEFGSESFSQSKSTGPPNITDGMTADEFWSKGSFNHSWYQLSDFQGNKSTVGLLGGSAYTESFVKETGICIASEAYSWGFSSLLLLTFCVYTLCFATALITLQTEVYRHSRLDREHQSHSIYADILTIAEALKSIPEYNLQDLLQSPKALDEKLGGRKHGVRFDVRGLPLARSDEKWALREEKLRDESASQTQGETELQLIEPVQEESRPRGAMLISRASDEQASPDQDETMSGAV